MKALRLFGPGDIRLCDVPTPVPRAGELILRVKAASICGTDVRMWQNGARGASLEHPLTLGHEFAGVIEAVGEGVDGYRSGMRVAVQPNSGCGRCACCQQGYRHLCRDLLGKSYDALEEAARSVPPGSNGLQFLPHFAGRVCPASPYLSGAWYGLKWNHGPGEMYRSVLESIAAEYRTYHEILTDSAAIGPGGRVLGTGGGAKSALLCQLKADALQMTYHPLPHADTALWGSAVVAGITIGVYNKDGKDNPMPASEQAPFVPSGDREETWRRIAGRQARLTESMIRYAEEENKCRKEAGDLCS